MSVHSQSCNNCQPHQHIISCTISRFWYFRTFLFLCPNDKILVFLALLMLSRCFLRAPLSCALTSLNIGVSCLRNVWCIWITLLRHPTKASSSDCYLPGLQSLYAYNRKDSHLNTLVVVSEPSTLQFRFVLSKIYLSNRVFPNPWIS